MSTDKKALGKKVQTLWKLVHNLIGRIAKGQISLGQKFLQVGSQLVKIYCDWSKHPFKKVSKLVL